MTALARRSTFLSRRKLLAAGGAGGFVALTAGLRLSVPKGLDASGYRQTSRIHGEDFPFTIEDPSGVRQVLERPPRRIMSTSYPGDEALTLLVSRDRVVSVTEGVDDAGIHNSAGHFPPAIHRNRAQLEEAIAQRPDLIVASDNTPAEVIRVLASADIIVVRFAFYESFQLVDRNTRLIARVLGASARADAVLADMWSRLAAVERAVAGAARPRLLWYNMRGNSNGPGTLNDEMIELAGASNIVRETGQTGSVSLPQEMAVSMLPEVIVLGEWTTGHQDREFILSSPAWRNVPAVRHGRVHVINSAWGTTGSPYRVRGVEQLASVLHPESFAR